MIIATGQTWRRCGESDHSTWRVVALTAESVWLSGPGPCRGMKEVSPDELEELWEPVDAV